MIVDLIVGIVSSLIASMIVGFLGNKAISKQNSIILKIYVLFLSATAFVVSAIISIVLNKNLMQRITQMNEVNILRFYQSCVRSLLGVLLLVVLMTGLVLLAEASDRSARRDHKQSMDRLKL